jgi:hypothetical protein
MLYRGLHGNKNEKQLFGGERRGGKEDRGMVKRKTTEMM